MQGMDPPTELDQQQRAAWLKDKHFLHQLMDTSKVTQAGTQDSALSALRPAWQPAGL